jgi:hypothetical protein
VPSCNLKGKRYKGCIKCKVTRVPVNIYGMKVGKKTIISEYPEKTGKKHLWQYLCDCGYKGVVDSNRFLKNTYKNCPNCSGNLSKGEDSAKKSPLWRRWGSIKSRCYNHKSPNYKWYGGRGITLEEYFHDFRNFEKWIIDNLGLPKEGLSLDRIDNDKGYQRGNLRWATGTEQNLNRRFGFFLSIEEDGEKLPVSVFCKKHSLDKNKVYRILRKGISTPEEIINKLRNK